MKENVLDVLVFLFQHYMVDDSEPRLDRESLRSGLLRAGFPAPQVGGAFEWLDGLADRRNAQLSLVDPSQNMRFYDPQEQALLDVSCRGFLLFLEQNGILNFETRELVIDRVMALTQDDMDLDRLKWVVLMVLFEQPGQEGAYACVEDWLLSDPAGYLH